MVVLIIANNWRGRHSLSECQGEDEYLGTLLRTQEPGPG